MGQTLVDPYRPLKRRVVNSLGPLFPYLYITRAFFQARSRRFWQPWMRSFSGQWLSADAVPWMSFAATEWLDKTLQPDMTVFEYGSGASTIFMAQRVKSLVTVEHNKEWYRKVEDAFRQIGITNCAYHFQPGKPHLDLDDPTEPISQCEGYVTLIDSYQDHSFDLVVVDGRARKACMEHAVPKIKRGGYLVLDNSNDPRLPDCFPMMASYPRMDFHGIAPGWPPGGWTTSVWRML